MQSPPGNPARNRYGRAADGSSASTMRTITRRILLVSSVGAAGISLVIGISAATPRLGLLTGISTLILPLVGPWLVVVAIPAAVIGGWSWWRSGSRRTTIAAGGAGAAAVLLNLVLVTSFSIAVGDAGGSINAFRAFAIGSMASPADAHEVYDVADGQEQRVAVFRPASGSAAAPILVHIHGGGWKEGSENDMGSDWRWFTDRGWLVFSAGYRLSSPGNPTWDKAPADVACALSWVARNASRYGGDPQRIGLMGESAGGNLALNLAYGAASGKTARACGGAVPVPKAVVAEYPALDPPAMFEDDFSLGALSGREMVEQYLGGVPASVPDRASAVTSVNFLTPQAPPTLVVVAERDDLVPPEPTYDFVDRARGTGIDITLARVPFANHAYDTLGSRSLGQQAYLTLAEQFLTPRISH